MVTKKVYPIVRKLNYNHYDEIISIYSQADFYKIPRVEDFSDGKRNSIVSGHNFLFLECSTMLNSLSLGVNYEFAFLSFTTISLGYNRGESFYFSSFLLTIRNTFLFL